MPTGKCPNDKAIPSLDSGNEMLRNLARLTSESACMDPDKRYTVKRLEKLIELQKNLRKYQTLLGEMQVAVAKGQGDVAVELVGVMERLPPDKEGG